MRSGTLKLLGVSLILNTGAVATVNGVIINNFYTEITVHPGACLKIQGGTLPNVPADNLWKGITV